MRRAEDHPFLGDAWIGFHELYDAKVDNLDLLQTSGVRAHEDVGVLDVAVDDPALVSVAQGTTDLADQLQSTSGIDGTASQNLGEPDTLDVLHRDVVAAWGDASVVVDDDDVGVIECGEGLGFQQEALPKRLAALAGRRCREDLEGHASLQRLLAGLPHARLTTARDQLYDPIPAINEVTDSNRIGVLRLDRSRIRGQPIPPGLGCSSANATVKPYLKRSGGEQPRWLRSCQSCR